MTATTTRPKLDPAVVRLAIVLLVGALAVVFDTTIVNVALDTLGRELHVGVTTVQWVTTGYLLALGVAVPVTGWLLDRWGGKRVWMSALTIFLAGSIGASLAAGAPTLIASPRCCSRRPARSCSAARLPWSPCPSCSGRCSARWPAA
jgi:MFS family permease